MLAFEEVMVHCHSPAARARRLARAVERGFITAGAGPGRAFIAVGASVAPRVKVMARSLELHEEHNFRAGRPAHYARHAALHAGLRDDELHRALASHRAANHAKHHWRRGGVSSSPEAGVDSEGGCHDPLPSGLRVESPLAQPLRCDSQQSFVFVEGPSARSEVRFLVETASDPLCALPVSTPPWCGDAGPLLWPGSYEDPAGGLLSRAQGLIDAQNATIMMLTRRVEEGALPFHEKDSRADLDRVKTLEGKCDRLASSLGQAVEESVTAKAAALRTALTECQASVLAAQDDSSKSVLRSVEKALLLFDSQIQTKLHQLEDQMKGWFIEREQKQLRVVEARSREQRPAPHATSTSRRTLVPPPRRRREMPCEVFYSAAQACKLRLPHILEPLRPLLMLCDGKDVVWTPCGVDDDVGASCPPPAPSPWAAHDRRFVRGCILEDMFQEEQCADEWTSRFDAALRADSICDLEDLIFGAEERVDVAHGCAVSPRVSRAAVNTAGAHALG